MCLDGRMEVVVGWVKTHYSLPPTTTCLPPPPPTPTPVTYTIQPGSLEEKTPAIGSVYFALTHVVCGDMSLINHVYVRRRKASGDSTKQAWWCYPTTPATSPTHTPSTTRLSVFVLPSLTCVVWCSLSLLTNKQTCSSSHPQRPDMLFTDNELAVPAWRGSRQFSTTCTGSSPRLPLAGGEDGGPALAGTDAHTHTRSRMVSGMFQEGWVW